MSGNMKYCTRCGAQIFADAEICPKCGVRVGPLQAQIIKVQHTKNPGLAAVLSALFMGIGQIYNGQISKGILMGVIAVICILTSVFILPAVILVALWIYGIYDAYKMANRINLQDSR